MRTPFEIVTWFVLLGCGSARVELPTASQQPKASQPGPQVFQQRPDPPTFRGAVSYEDGAPAGGALIAITNLASGRSAGVVVADLEGRFEAKLGAGEYALAVTTGQGFGWIEKEQVPNVDAKLTLSRSCRTIAGRANGTLQGTRVNLLRRSLSTGDTFVADVQSDGTFSLCVPEAYYGAYLSGPVVSFVREVNAKVSTAASIELHGLATREIRQAPPDMTQPPGSADRLIDDILASDPRVIGLGESTHGTAEMTSVRGAFVLDLVRRAGVRLVLLENDAILATALDDYITGGDVDLAKAVSGLTFWITDTYEFHRFLQDLRAYNATTNDKVRLWGIDVQDVEPAVKELLASAAALRLSSADKAMLEELIPRRARAVLSFPASRRSALEALLTRLSKPRSAKYADLRVSVAARSLAVQITYYDDDLQGRYFARRDTGMAGLANFLLEQTRARRAVVWAHSGHVSRELYGGQPTLGRHLAAVAANRYYPVGFYVFQGEVRAWDSVGAVGVIAHSSPAAPKDTVEGAVMAATGAPEIAWLPLRALSPVLRTWLGTPRYVRELGAVYVDEDDMMTLRDIPAAFDALVVIKNGHGSSPTPTGVRKVDKAK